MEMVQNLSLPYQHQIEGFQMKKYDILFVDDDPLVLRTAQILLKEFVNKLVLVESGERCLEEITNDKQFDLILLDVMMPVMGGITILEKIRQDPLTASLKVLLQTGMMDVNEKEVKKLDASVIFKPYTKAQLLQAIERTLS